MGSIERRATADDFAARDGGVGLHRVSPGVSASGVSPERRGVRIA